MWPQTTALKVVGVDGDPLCLRPRFLAIGPDERDSILVDSNAAGRVKTGPDRRLRPIAAAMAWYHACKLGVCTSGRMFWLVVFRYHE